MKHHPLVLIQDRTNGLLYTSPTQEDHRIFIQAEKRVRYMNTREGFAVRYCALSGMLRDEKRDARITLDMGTAFKRGARPTPVMNACIGLSDNDYMRIYQERYFTPDYAPRRPLQ